MNQRRVMMGRRKFLKPHIKKLRKFCHHKSCKNINGCPINHGKKCSENLGLHTAISWTCASKISMICTGNTINSAITLEELYFTIESFRYAICLHWNSSLTNSIEKYIYLDEILSETSAHLEFLIISEKSI